MQVRQIVLLRVVELALLDFNHHRALGTHLVELLQQFVTDLGLSLVECLDSGLDLLHGVELEPLLVDRVEQLVHPVEEDADVLLDLLIAHQVLKVAVRVVRVFYLVKLDALGFHTRGLHLGRQERLRCRLLLAHGELLVDDAHLGRLKVQHEHAVQTQDRFRVLLQVDQVVLRHEATAGDKEIFGLTVKRIVVEAVNDEVHVDISSADQRVERSPVLLRDVLHDELAVVLLYLQAALFVALGRYAADHRLAASSRLRYANLRRGSLLHLARAVAILVAQPRSCWLLERVKGDGRRLLCLAHAHALGVAFIRDFGAFALELRGLGRPA